MLVSNVTELSNQSTLETCHAFDHQTMFADAARQRVVGRAGCDRAAGLLLLFLSDQRVEVQLRRFIN